MSLVDCWLMRIVRDTWLVLEMVTNIWNWEALKRAGIGVRWLSGKGCWLLFRGPTFKSLITTAW